MRLGSTDTATRVVAMLRDARQELAAWFGRGADNGEGKPMAEENKPDEHRIRVTAIQDAIQDLRWNSEKAYPTTTRDGRLAQGFIDAVAAFFARLAD